MKGKSSDLSLSAVLLLLFLAITSYIVVAINETNSTGNASDDVLNTDINLTLPDTTEIIVENLTENNTIENITSEINSTEAINETNKIITLNLEYGPGLESIIGLIDLDVSNTEFSWKADESKLCTKWEVYSLDKDNITRVCYGSEKCCALADLKPALSSWKDALELYMGRYGTSSSNIITAQVIYADYNLSIDEPFSEFYNSNTEKLAANFSQEKPEIKFDRDIICDKCSNHKVSPLTEFIMVISAGISSYFEGILSDYIPSAFTVVNPIGGMVTEVNENYTRIDWDVAGDNISREYILLGPERTNPTSKYYFHSELNNQSSDDWMIVVADPGAGMAEKECVLPDVAFSVNDMQTNSDTAILSKNGVSITLRGVKADSIKKLPEFKDGILTVDSSISIKNATLSIPHCGIKPVMVSPKLYVRENKDDFKIAEPYCNGNDCFNSVRITPTSYIFNVEHFSDYTINSSGGFETLAACLKYINNTANSCYITEKGYYDINKWQINASEIGFNKSGLVLAYDFDFNHSINNITWDASDSKNNGTVTYATDTWNAIGYYGGTYQINDMNSYINAGNSISLTTQGARTIEFWMKSTQTAGNKGVIGFYGTGGSKGFSFIGTSPLLLLDNNNYRYWSSMAGYFDGKWHHVAVVMTGAAQNDIFNAALRVDGVLLVSSTTTNASAPSAWGYHIIARDTFGNFNGSIDQIRIYNRTLSQSEIEQHYAGDVGKYNLSGDGIVINSANVTLNCNGSTLKGDGTDIDIDGGISYHRQGGNITVRNCIMEGFYNNYDFDFWSDADKNLTINDCTSIEGTGVDYFGYVRVMMKNFTAVNSKGFYLSQEEADNGFFEDVNIINCSGSMGDEGCLYIEYGDRNTFRRINVTTTINPSSALKSAVSFTVGAQDNIFEDSYVKAPGITGIKILDVNDNYRNTIRNTTIEDSNIGIYVKEASNSIINNIIRNISRQAILYEDGGVAGATINITNNSISNAGNATRLITDYLAGYSPMGYSNVYYNGTVLFVWNSGGSTASVTSNDTVIAGATGANSWKLMLYQDDNSPVLGCGNWCNGTVYADDTYPLDCAGIVAAYGGACVEWHNAFIANGANANYTWNSSIPTTVINGGSVVGANPPYLHKANLSWQEAFPITVITGNNWANISGNTIEITDGRENYYSMNLTADAAEQSNVWLNNFYTHPLAISGNADFCVNNEGNFYEESLSVPGGDCGPASITYPAGGESFDGSALIKSNWTKQSAIKAVYYDVFVNKTSNGVKTYIGTTTDLNITINANELNSGNYIVFIIPYITGPRINATNAAGNTFTIATANSAPTISSVMLNATSLSNLTSDNLTAHPSGVSDADGDSVTLNYNWYRNGVSDAILNMPFTAPDSLNRTYDFSGYANHGTIKNGAVWNKTAGYDGFGAYMLNSNSYINMTNSSGSLNIIGKGITISAWINPSAFTGAAGFEGIVMKTSTNSWNDGYGIYWYNNLLSFYVTHYSLNMASISFPSATSTNKWYHIVGTYNGSDVRIFLNGVEGTKDTYSGSITSTTNNLFIGQGTGGYYFNGTIDEVRVWNRSLSANEIALLYNNRTNTTHADATVAGDEWQVKVTPIDEHGLNGSSVQSNMLTVAENKQIDVYNLSTVYSEGSLKIFKFKTKNIESQANSINYTSLNTSENNINTSIAINLNPGKEVFTFVDYSYIGTGVFKVTAYANSTLTDDEDQIDINIS